MMGSAGSLFDIIGPVMVGPSSSHTAGAVRLARLARSVANRPIHQAQFTLYNSFAKTYKGHGTDRGLLAGLLGASVDDDLVRDALAYADTQGLDYTFIPEDKPNPYPPNTVQFDLTLDNNEHLVLLGHSVGGGRVYLSRINDYRVSLWGEYPTVVMVYRDQPGMIWQVTKLIAEAGINIASLNCTRKDKGTEAFMSICLDTLLAEEKVDSIRHISGVHTVHNVDRLL
jgi:L-serine dehydratase